MSFVCQHLRELACPESQSTQPMKAGGLGFFFLFFFKGLNEVIASC